VSRLAELSLVAFDIESFAPSIEGPPSSPHLANTSVMDPLSIGSAVVGLIAAATHIAPLLHFISHTRNAPKSASQVLDEMQSTKAALEQLQVYVIGASTTNPARREMLLMHSIVTTLTACVTTYSDVERLVNKCVSDGVVYRIMWIYYEHEVSELLQKIQAHKMSLVLMLSVLQWYVTSDI
jgi:hypothetical protein